MGLPPQVGLYGYLLGRTGYALFGSSRHLAVGPTSAISLMVAGTVSQMADGDAVRYGQIATLAGLVVGALCATAWLLRLGTLTSFVSEGILLGFKAGAGLSIASTEFSGLLGVPGGGDDIVAILAGGSAWAQMSLTPRMIKLDTLTCRELLSFSGDQRDRLLIYLSGYFDGTRGASTWDERLTGERIDRALAECKSKPETPVLRAFADAWSR